MIEFKLNDSQVAIDQIKQKRYVDSFLASGKTVFALGLAFDTVERNVKEKYILEPVV
ncbi:MAG: hypothetical protein AB1458_11180 [Bacteroidota bacterium]